MKKPDHIIKGYTSKTGRVNPFGFVEQIHQRCAGNQYPFEFCHWLFGFAWAAFLMIKLSSAS
jgi:hypothetical protein